MRGNIVAEVYQSHIVQVCGTCSSHLDVIDAVDDKVDLWAAPWSRMATQVIAQIIEKLPPSLRENDQ